MCFVPFLATKTPPKLYPRFGLPQGQVVLSELDERCRPVLDKFTLPHCGGIELIIGCGCWLRHVNSASAYAGLVDDVLDPGYDPAPEQPNHDGLADYLEKYFQQDGFVEFYGCWDGDFAKPAEARMKITAGAIRHPHFHFRMGALYRIAFVA